MKLDRRRKLGPIGTKHARTPEDRDGNVRVIDRAGQLLFALYEAREPMSLGQLSAATGLKKTTTHRLLSSLGQLRFVSHDAERKIYRLGLGLVDLGYAAVTGIDLRTIARRHLRELANKTAQTVHLGIQDGDQVVYIDKIDGTDQGITLSSWIGKRVPLNTTSLGKILLSGNDDKGLRSSLRRLELVRSTANSITDPAVLFEVCREVRNAGYAIDNGEQNELVKCAAAPIRNSAREVVAALSVSTIGIEIDSQKFRNHIRSAMDAASKISGEIGFRSL